MIENKPKNQNKSQDIKFTKVHQLMSFFVCCRVLPTFFHTISTLTTLLLFSFFAIVKLKYSKVVPQVKLKRVILRQYYVLFWYKIPSW